MATIEQTFKRLEKSKFRAGFHLDSKDKEYVTAKGTDKIREHAEDFIKKRLAPAYIANDGRQTPCIQGAARMRLLLQRLS